MTQLDSADDIILLDRQQLSRVLSVERKLADSHAYCATAFHQQNASFLSVIIQEYRVS